MPDPSTTPSLPYAIATRVAGADLAAARARVEAALKEEGFGVLTEIDVKATFQDKLGRAFRRYLILGACNPHLAYSALGADLGVGLLLPCNVCLWEDDGGVAVAAVDPEAMLQLAAGSGAIAEIAREAKARIGRAIERIKTAP